MLTAKELAGAARRVNRPVFPDEGCSYSATIEMDIGGLGPMVSAPEHLSNGASAASVIDTIVQQGFIGSCTNARLEDLRMACAVLRGRRVHAGCRLVVTPPSAAIYTQAMEEGLIQAIAEAGGVVTSPGCGSCPGRGMGLLDDGEVCISSGIGMERGVWAPRPRRST